MVREVVKDRPISEVVEVKDVRKEKVYLVKTSRKQYGIITATHYESGSYGCLMFNGITCNNKLSKGATFLKPFIRSLLSNGDKVYQFDSMIQLCKYVAEDFEENEDDF